jgi:transcription elongation factor GreA
MSGRKDVVLLTKEGFRKLNDELKMREGEIRQKLQETLKQMTRQGDLRENDGYSMAVEEYQNNEEKILEIKNILEKAEIIKKKSTNVVEVGSKVTIEDDKGDKKTYYIVGIDEANPLEMRISYNSPIGSSLIGKKKGSSITIDLPTGKMSYRIVAIE